MDTVKRTLALLIGLSALALSLTACGGETSKSDTSAADEASVSSQEETEAQTTETEAPETTTEAETEAETEAPTEAATEAPTEEETVPPTEAATEPADNSAPAQITPLYGYPYALSFELDLVSSSISDVTGDSVMSYAVTDTGEGYAVTGTLTYKECAPVSVADLGEGDTFCTTSNKEYTIVKCEYDDNGRGTFYLTGADGNKYTIHNLLSFDMDMVTGTPYYTIKSSDEPVYVTLENASFQIPYGTPAEDWLKDTLHYASYTAGHIYTLTFDENGNVTMYESY